MPIYMEIEGIKGNVTASGRSGEANFALADGSVKNIGRPGGGPRVVVYDGSGNGGGILVSKIALPNSTGGAVDAFAPDAVVKARAMFEAQRSAVTALGVVFSLPANGANKFRHDSNLRQISLALHGQISTLRFFVTDGSGQTGVTIELENCLISSYSISGHGGAASAGELFKACLVGEGKAVRIDF